MSPDEEFTMYDGDGLIYQRQRFGILHRYRTRPDYRWHWSFSAKAGDAAFRKLRAEQ